MQAQIISIGDELLIGDTVNTNASWLGTFFAEHGIQTTAVYTIGDDADAIRRSITEAMQQADIVITTGGLGPTHDDITKHIVADIFESDMVLHEPTLAFIKEVFEKRNIPFSKSNYKQAEVPKKCTVLTNKRGTAPGLWFERDDHILAVLPGIPHEMQGLLEYQIMPRLTDRIAGKTRTFARHIQTAGVGESTLSDEVIGELDDYLTNDISVAYLPSPEVNTIRVNTRATSEQQATQKSKALVEHIYNRAGHFIIGEGKELTLSKATGKVLAEADKTIAVAESCTGGGLANAITNTPGSSDYFLGGITAYSNALKKQFLDVSQDQLENHGAVSRAVALQMAKAVATNTGSSLGLSTTGIAGPGGGSDKKPVGTVWIGFWSAEAHFALHTTLTKNRLMNKTRSIAIALETTRRSVRGIEHMPYELKKHWA